MPGSRLWGSWKAIPGEAIRLLMFLGIAAYASSRDMTASADRSRNNVYYRDMI